MSYDPYEEAQERYANEFDRKREERKGGGDAPHVFPNDAREDARQLAGYNNQESYTGAQDRREHHPGRRIDNYDPYEEEYEPSEPDYEAMVERRQERYRPDWA